MARTFEKDDGIFDWMVIIDRQRKGEPVDRPILQMNKAPMPEGMERGSTEHYFHLVTPLFPGPKELQGENPSRPGRVSKEEMDKIVPPALVHQVCAVAERPVLVGRGLKSVPQPAYPAADAMPTPAPSDLPVTIEKQVQAIEVAVAKPTKTETPLVEKRKPKKAWWKKFFICGGSDALK